MKARTLGMAIAGVIMAGMLTACGTESAASNEEVNGVIGYLCYDMDQDTEAFADELRAEAGSLGYDCRIVSLDGNDKKMVSECIGMLSEDVDVLVVTPDKSVDAQPVAEAAHVNDVSVVLNGFGSGVVDYDKLVSTTGNAGGKAAAKSAVELMTGGN
ncbi:hypothetical protein MCG98_17105 [Ruminococcus sp. OA3]|uniref:hypothetical protein n=1 Tax=Ruminococcus sp. OA3 TaxID=2914164 RepID=UPI001F055249|nr:hypothetical protein [Ruminococcus sp. OA3]MCH1984288.1 hypothetical protein [Ruminococcus sp. OA3]